MKNNLKTVDSSQILINGFSEKPTPVYPIMGTWFSRVRFVLQQAQYGLTIREIAKWIISFEPGLTKERSLSRITKSVSVEVCQKRSFFHIDKSNGNKKSKYSLKELYASKQIGNQPKVYPINGTWPKKIEFIMRQECRKLTNNEITELAITKQPESRKNKKIISCRINRALNSRTEIFCSETSLNTRSSLYYLRGGILQNDSHELTQYPLREKWVRRIIFILQLEHKKVTPKELAKLVLTFQPEMANRLNSLYSVVSQTLRKNPEIFCRDKSTGKNAHYWLADQNFSVQD